MCGGTARFSQQGTAMILIQQSARQSQERWLERLRRNGYVKHF
jgi:hypothetical protein